MNILLAFLITVGVIILGFFVASLATITYSDCFYSPNLYDIYKTLKKRSENKGLSFNYTDFNDFLERYENIKVGSEKYEQLKKFGQFEDQTCKEVWIYYWAVWGGYFLISLASIVYTLYLIVVWLIEPVTGE